MSTKIRKRQCVFARMGVTKRYPIFVDQDITSSMHHPILGRCLLLATIGEPVTGHSILQMFAIAIDFLYRSIIEASSNEQLY